MIVDITQNGNPPQNPANPELMLSARPKTKIITSNVPMAAVNNFITGVIMFLSYSISSARCLSIQFAVLNNLSSSSAPPTSCTPIGNPASLVNNGSVTQGRPHRVQIVEKIGFPVPSSKYGAGPDAAGVKIASKSRKNELK